MVKVISLSEEAYTDLKVLKGKEESFSDVVVKLAAKKKKHNLMDFFGIWKDNEEMDKIFKEIFEERRKIKMREVKF